MNILSRTLGALTILVAATAACATTTDGPDGTGGAAQATATNLPEVVTFNKHAMPLIQQEGQACHHTGGLAPFALSPLPSAQLFVAAGLLGVRLLPLTAVFFAGRLVSYSIYVGGASLASDSLGDTLTGAFTSPLGVALQILMLAGLVALVRVDWLRVLARHS